MLVDGSKQAPTCRRQGCDRPAVVDVVTYFVSGHQSTDYDLCRGCARKAMEALAASNRTSSGYTRARRTTR